MSLTLDGLKEAQEVRQSKFSQALKKSSLENGAVQKADSKVKAPTWNFKWVLTFLVLLILAVSIAVFLALRSFSPAEKVINPVIKPVQLVKSALPLKVKARKPLVHKIPHHKIKKKIPVVLADD